MCLGFMFAGIILVGYAKQFDKNQKKIWMINATNEPGCYGYYYGIDLNDYERID